jgi:hypothetical protein
MNKYWENVKGFSIEIKGDRSVGIPSEMFVIEPQDRPFNFDCESDYLAFQDKIKEAFDYAYNYDCMPVNVMRYVDMEEDV